MRINHFQTALALLSGLLLMWTASGTLSPYAATFSAPRVSSPCGYLFSFDHCHFEASFWLLNGMEKQAWEWSIYLRRIFYPLISFPLMHSWGFVLGGFLTNLVLFALSFLIFVLYVAQEYGTRSATAVGWLLATYAGSAYWIGLPYQMAAIVPASLTCTLLFCKVQSSNSVTRNMFLCFFVRIYCFSPRCLNT